MKDYRMLVCRVNPDFFEKVKQYVEKKGMSKTALMVLAIEEFIRKNK